MTPESEGEGADARAARRTRELEQLIAGATGEPLIIANEFAEVVVRRVETRNGARILIQSPKSGQWISLDPLEIEALTWQNTATFAAMVGNMNAPLIAEDGDKS